MAEESSELENNKISISAADTENASLEVGAPANYASTALGDHSSHHENNASNVPTTGGATEVVDATAEPEEIREKIEQTRSNMSETINAIQEKLSISNLVESARDEVSDQISGAYKSAKTALFGNATEKMGNLMTKVKNNVDKFSEDYGPAISGTTQNLVETVKSNPIPFIFIGLGFGFWLLRSRRSGANKVKSYRYVDGFDDDDLDYGYSDTELQNFAPSRNRSTVKKVYGKVSDVAGQAGETVANAANTAYSGVSNAAGSAYEGVGSVAGKAYEGVGNVAGKAYEQVGNLGTGVKQAASWTQETYSDQLEENPLAVGAVAFALGAVIGLSIPSTEIEGQYMGEARQNLIQQAQDKAGDLISQAQQVAGDLTKSVKDEAKAQGFTA
jgi:hypothetical protein